MDIRFLPSDSFSEDIWSEASRLCKDTFARRALSLLEKAYRETHDTHRDYYLSKVPEEISVVKDKEERAFLTGLWMGVLLSSELLETINDLQEEIREFENG